MFAMPMRAIGSGFGAVMFVIGINVLSANAGVATPNGFLAGTAQAPVSNIGWRCEERRCFWRPEYAGPVPPFAVGWGPPDYPTCYYVKRRISKR